VNTKNIVPISEHRSHITEHIKRVQETGEALVITQQGRAAGVLLSPAAYDALVEAARLNQDIDAIKAGIESVERGHGVDARDALRALAKKHNIDLAS